MFEVSIPHNQQGQAALKFKTEDRKVARMAALVGEAMGVKVKVTEEVVPRDVKFKGVK